MCNDRWRETAEKYAEDTCFIKSTFKKKCFFPEVVIPAVKPLDLYAVN